MKKLTSILFAVIFSCMVHAQETSKLTVFPDFRPAIAHLTDGRTLTLPFANIFLKNGSLLYKSGTQTMQANMKNIVSVDFAERQYIKIDTLLAHAIDSVGQNRIYQATLVDIEAYKAMLRNNTDITSLSLGDNFSYSTVGPNSDDERAMPLVNQFYFLYNGKMLRVHERVLWHELPKEKRRAFKTIISLPTFSWSDPNSLKQLLSVM